MSRINPHCPVVGCKATAPHTDDSVVSGLMRVFAPPASICLLVDGWSRARTHRPLGLVLPTHFLLDLPSQHLPAALSASVRNLRSSSNSSEFCRQSGTKGETVQRFPGIVLLPTRIDHWCLFTMLVQTQRSRPVPTSVLAVKKGSKIFGRMHSGMPDAVSGPHKETHSFQQLHERAQDSFSHVSLHPALPLRRAHVRACGQHSDCAAWIALCFFPVRTKACGARESRPRGCHPLANHSRTGFLQARELQRVLIPEALPTIPGFTLTSAYKPALEVRDDFFPSISLARGSTFVVLGDVSGKGVKAAIAVADRRRCAHDGRIHKQPG